MSKKMGFGAVLAIVFGSQIGSGIFMLPANLAPYGMLGIYSWIFAGLGAILLALVFADLCSRYPKVGGPHVYVKEVFGKLPSFLTGWGYWLVSWISSAVVVITSIAYLTPILRDISKTTSLLLEISLLMVITAVNCKGVESAGRLESVLVFLKFIPFVIVPAIIFNRFDASNIVVADRFADLSDFNLTISAVSLCFWGFIGVECATTPAGFVQNPSKTIPRAIIVGTCAVATIYIINNAVIMGVIPGSVLETSQAPFADAVRTVMGGESDIWYILLAVVASIVCVGTLNAWVLTSAQISLGLAEDNLLPKFFAKKNRAGSPYVSILISTIGTLPILILTKYDNSIAEQVTSIIDISVKTFIIVYLVCCLAFLKISIGERKIWKCVVGITAMAFCLLMLQDSDLKSVLIVASFFLSGVFMLPLMPSMKKNG
ncbi:amino acid permease [Alphaproteobacteria bacterium]|nr:amino acid permease [Alphaproteobacteria bacterium]